VRSNPRFTPGDIAWGATTWENIGDGDDVDEGGAVTATAGVVDM
jgi:hypothetical protein